MLGLPRCLSFGGLRIDAAIADELLRAVEPMAIEAALRSRADAHGNAKPNNDASLELELQQARYEASLAERRYAACDPDNRLIAAQLEKSWEAALRRVRGLPGAIGASGRQTRTAVAPDFAGLADDLDAAWNAPGVTMRTRQRLLRALVTDIIADVDEAAREVILTIHWRGGQHSQLRVRKPKSGEHGCRTSEEALAVIRSMATRWSDEDIAASLNRMGMPTGQGKTWTAHRVSSLRRVRGIHAYRSAEKNGEWLTMSEAATKLGVTNHRNSPADQGSRSRRRAGRAGRPIPDPRLRSRDERRHRRARANRSPVSRRSPKIKYQCFHRLEEGGHNERLVAMQRTAFSAMLLSASRRASVAKRVSALRRLMM